MDRKYDQRTTMTRRPDDTYRKAKQDRKEDRVLGTEGMAGRAKGGGPLWYSAKHLAEGRRSLRDSEYHLLLKFPRGGNLGKNSAPVTSSPRAPARPPYSPISMASPVGAQVRGMPPREDSEEARGLFRAVLCGGYR